MAASLGKLCCNQLPLTARKIGSGWLHFRAQGAGQFHPGPWRSLSSGRQRFNAASLGLQARSRPFTLLIATGGGYMGYDQYGRYKDRELTKIGIEVPPRIANEAQADQSSSSLSLSPVCCSSSQISCETVTPPSGTQPLPSGTK
ncbi:phosphatidylserine decarboxylase proenzyme, mitochondrial-like [Salvelinus namaycush]|uniref:Phosphatidylserine decarboxylase proenzyme, mitochondrial-like n=1 Tax=Salvelinus namaycush TaxID=8040 RepID=A0A8U0TR13_SALNM|nr:phosphatidylserine decarboxylase proenzyme, mitochondrial-like [Salvelinus namaycush]